MSKLSFFANFAIFGLGLILGCSQNSPNKSPPSQTQFDRYVEVSMRLPNFLDNGWVVSRGSQDNHGDSLIFTGLAMYGLSCSDGEAEASALEKMLLSGSYYRYPGDTDAVSLDQRLGLYRGITARFKRCNETARWAQALSSVQPGGLPPEFSYLEDKLRAALGLAGNPASDKQAALEAEIASWAAGVNATHAACYRINLGLITLQTIEELDGHISTLGRNAFCAATKGTNLPTVEAWCGRTSMAAYLNGFQYNVWVYRHQRCPAWEAPDGNGEAQSGVDYLVAYMDGRTP